MHGRAHNGPVNGIVWINDGRHLVSTGHDERIRVWDVIKGANTGSHFGPVVRNRELATSLPCLAPPEFGPPKHDVMFFPNEREILMYELFEGKLLKRLRVPGMAAQQTLQSGQRERITAVKERIKSLTWRAHSVELYSAHSDGHIRAWLPRTKEDVVADQEDKTEEQELDEERKRKRDALDEVYRDLTRQKITFS